MMEAHFRALGVHPGADTSEIRRAYRSLALRWHPDKHQEPDERAAAVERFLEIQAAYEALTGATDDDACSSRADVNAWKEEFEKRRAEREKRQREWAKERKEKEAQLASAEAERRRASEAWDSQFEARLAACRRERQTSLLRPHECSVSPIFATENRPLSRGGKARNIPLDSMDREREKRRQRWDEDQRQFREAVRQIEAITASWPVAKDGCETMFDFSADHPAAVYG